MSAKVIVSDQLPASIVELRINSGYNNTEIPFSKHVTQQRANQYRWRQNPARLRSTQTAFVSESVHDSGIQGLVC